MLRAEFAALCGVTKPMITKYAGDERLVFADAKHIDPEASLALLEGTLDEGKRRAALQTLADQRAREAPPATVAPPVTPPPPSAEQPRSAKAGLEEVKLQLANIELAERAGKLVSAADVERRAWEAIAAMRTAYDQARADTAEQLCRDLNLPPERVGAMQRTLQRLQSMALAAFQQTMGVVGEPPEAVNDDAPAESERASA